MPQRTRAQIQREYRQRRDADSARRQQYLKKEHDKYVKDLLSGKRKRVQDISNERELRKTRREWKKRQRISRQRAKLRSEATALSPPATPCLSFEPGSHESRQKIRSRRVRRKESASAHRKIAKLEAELLTAKRKAEKYKKRFQRERVAGMKLKPDTPRTKTRKLLANFGRHKQSVRKTLVFHYALIDQIKNRYQDSKTEREKRTFAHVLSGRIIKQYRLQKMSQQHMGFSVRRWSSYMSMNHVFGKSRKDRSGTQRCQFRDVVVNFYTRDDVSRATAGKKDTVTRHKNKMQKRLLLDTLSNTHLKFCSEFVSWKISYSLFCQLRPFWVVFPTSSDRETCLCKVHDNLQLTVDSLVDLKVLQNVSVERLCDAIACNSANKACMYGACSSCANRQLEFFCDHEYDSECTTCTNGLPKLRMYERNKIVTCYRWKTKVDVASDGKKNSIVCKDNETLELGTLVHRFFDMLSAARRHVFNIRHQYLQYRNCRSRLDDTSCMLHIDFAENYLCQYHKEIQSVHFGGSHHQTTMHTGVLYVGQEKPTTFCTISDSRAHDPIAIWEYLAPVLTQLRRTYPRVTNVHIFSDGPTTQYRQKKNFFLFATKLFQYGFSYATWNFFEASHGKGAADGVGAVLKRTADRLVKHGLDLPSARDVYSQLTSVTNVQLHFVEADHVKASLDAFDASHSDLRAVPGTMTLHQLVVESSKQGNLLYRDISCFCSGISGNYCECYNLTQFQFPNSEPLVLRSPGHSERSSSLQESGNRGNHVELEVLSANIAESASTVEVQSSSAEHSLQPIVHSEANLIGLYCIVQYDNKAYPGVILESDESDVTVECMHKIGTKYDQNRFFWPRKIKDICAYSYKDILTLIPAPERLSDHGRGYSQFRVDPILWDRVQMLLK